MSNIQDDKYFEDLKEELEELGDKIESKENLLRIIQKRKREISTPTCSVCKREWMYGAGKLTDIEESSFICPECEEVINDDLDEWELQRLKNKYNG